MHPTTPCGFATRYRGAVVFVAAHSGPSQRARHVKAAPPGRPTFAQLSTHELSLLLTRRAQVLTQSQSSSWPAAQLC